MVQQTINLYAWRENEKMIPPVLITQGESDTRTATFRLLDQATTIDLTGKSVSFEYDKPDGFHVSLVCQPTENPGECTCTFSDQAAIAPGIVNDTRVMVRSGTDVLEIVGPRLYIAVGINASAIVSSSEFQRICPTFLPIINRWRRYRRALRRQTRTYPVWIVSLRPYRERLRATKAN